MVLTETASTAASAESFVPVVVALVTAAAAVLAPRLAARADDLKRAERLTALLGDMPPSPQRDLLEELRDDYATVWALRQAAPVSSPLHTASRAAYFAGVLVLVIGPVLLLLMPGMQWWYWVWYLCGLTLLFIGVALHRRAAAARRRWMLSELRARGLAPPLDGRLGDRRDSGRVVRGQPAGRADDTA
jgi:hypothetical protein